MGRQPWDGRRGSDDGRPNRKKAARLPNNRRQSKKKGDCIISQSKGKRK
nr:MAG TPA: hypothetical protein [Caudoviricetes sp.]